MFDRFRSGVRFNRDYILASFLLINTFSWFFIAQKKVAETAELFSESMILTLVFPVSIIAATFVGAVFLSNIRKAKLFYSWVALGVFSSILLGAPLVTPLGALVVIVLVGCSLGLGIPSCLTYFTESVPIEKRGKVGGFSLFVTTLSVPLVASIMNVLDFTASLAVFSAWRGCAFLALPLMSKEIKFEEKICRKQPSFLAIFSGKTFSLYLVAWLMFSLVDGFEAVVLEESVEQFRFMLIIEQAVAGFSALIAGIVSDWIGRKRVLIFGFVSIGVAYAIIGLVPHWLSWIFYFVMDGVALGLLLVLFVIVMWGDFSTIGREKYYAIGQMPFFLTQIASLLLAPSVELIPTTSSFSLAAFFLFIAVIPLLYARETLPETKIQQRQIKIYTEEALRMKQKVEQD